MRAGFEATRFQSQQGPFTIDDVDCLQKKLQSLSLSEKEVAKQQSILQSLTFDSRPVRHTQISVAYEQTFRWALTTNPDASIDPGIGDWLKQGDGIFWISGKPGSGKSTLMKFIADSPITSRLITEWAQPSKAIIASHYFWIAGTSMQKSHQGLLQTLLYDVFRQCPYLIGQTCPERWASSQPVVLWSLGELRQALQTVSSRNNVGLKFCFFIDGMDEYSGDHENRTQLCRTFKDLAASGNIKLCLSSRPWNVFEEAFGLEFPKLYVQDLTRDDIQKYVEGRLQEHPRWATVSANHLQGQWLVSEITAKSNGVFLWVFLVTKLLRESLTNRDGLFDLHRRLRIFPSELEPFFKNMLESVEPFYHSHMSTALQIATASGERPLDFLIYHFHAQEYGDEDYATNLPIRFMNENEVQEIKSNTSWHLDSRTRGLLEVHPQDGTVGFLHRTVRDFLNTREMYDFLSAKVDDHLRFNPVLSILKAYTVMIKVSSVPSRIQRITFGKYETTSSSMLIRLSEALEFAKELEIHVVKDSRYHTLLDELDRSLQCLLPEHGCEFIPRSLSRMKQSVLREKLVQLGLFDYLHSKLNSEPTFLADLVSLPIMWFLVPGPNQEIPLQRGRGVDVLACILESRGRDLNKRDDCGGISPWTQLLSYICHMCPVYRENAITILIFLLEEGIFILLLKAGADPNVKVVSPGFTFQGKRHRAAARVYLEFCFQFVDQSQPVQEHYLDALKEFLRLSNDGTLRDVCDEFSTVLTNMSEVELPQWHLPFLSRVNDWLLLSLDAHRLGATEIRLAQDRMARRIFPLELYTPLNAVTKDSTREQRKRKNESGDPRRKNRRKA